MKKTYAFLTFCAALLWSGSVIGQIYYHQSPGAIVITGTSVILPTATITPSGITTNNPSNVLYPQNDAFSDQINNIFLNVDRSPVTTGLLRDYGLEIADVTKYPGTISGNNYLNAEEWQAVYLTLYSFRFKQNVNMKHPAELNAILLSQSNAQNGGSTPAARLLYSQTHDVTHMMMALHYKYEQFKSDALTSNLVSISNNQIFDVAGRPTTPYEIKETFAFAINNSVIYGNYHNFLLTDAMFPTNTGKTISTIQVDFGEGVGYQNISLNVVKSVAYSNPGNKTVKCKVTYTDNSVYESMTQISVMDALSLQARYTGSATQSITTEQFITGLLTYSQSPAPAQVRISTLFGFNSSGVQDFVLNKPLIWIEGFDPGSFLFPTNPRANQSFRKLLDDVNNSTQGFADVLMIEPGGGTPVKSLSDRLQEAGFDVIYVDFVDGTDYIQNNAYAVQEVIRFVNNNKVAFNGTMQQNVVVGTSMGGLIGRWALRDLEQRAITHDTRLFVAFDSPHQGANVPLAFQTTVGHLSNVHLSFGLAGFYGSAGSTYLGQLVPILGRASELADRPAVKQMLINSVFQTPVPPFGFISSSIRHTNFQQELDTKGYPQNCRNIVIANGSECAQDQGYAPLTSYLSYHDKFSLPAWANWAMHLGAGLGFVTNYPQFFLLIVPSFSSHILVDFDVKALPNQGSDKIYDGQVRIQRKVLGIINMNINITHEQAFASPSMLPIDSGPGSFLDLAESAGAVTGGSGTLFGISMARVNFAFIPTYSALDVGSGTATITLADLNAQYNPVAPPTGTKSIPAANWITGIRKQGAANNESHVAFTPRNTRWLWTEISGSVAPASSCGIWCSGPGGASLVGPATICSGTSTPFVLSNVPSTVFSQSFSFNSSLLTSTGSTANSITLKQNGSAQGNTTVSANLQSDCGTFTVSASQSRVGVHPNSDYPVNGPNTICVGGTKQFNTTLFNNESVTYDWFADGAASEGSGEFSYQFEAHGDFNGSATVGVVVSNACGPGTASWKFVTVGSSCGSRIASYPNPANETLHIGLIDALDEDDFNLPTLEVSGDKYIPEVVAIPEQRAKAFKQPGEGEQFEIKIFDMGYREVFHVFSSEADTEVHVGTLAPGHYILYMGHKNGVDTKHLLIER